MNATTKAVALTPLTSLTPLTPKGTSPFAKVKLKTCE